MKADRLVRYEKHLPVGDLARHSSVPQVDNLSICEGQVSGLGIESQGAAGTLEVAVGILRIGIELRICGRDSAILREGGPAPESTDGVALAISGDGLVGPGTGVVVGELDGHGLRVSPLSKGRNSREKEGERQDGRLHVGQ